MTWFGDTTYKENWTPQMLDSIGMKPLKQSGKPFYFRYSFNNEAIDIWSNDLLHYHGQLFCFTQNWHKKMRYFGKMFPINDSVVNEIADLYYTLNIQKISEEDSLLGYGKYVCVDCYSYSKLYEFSNGAEYTQKRYALLFSFKDSIKDAKIIDSFSNYIETKAETNKKFDEFIEDLPNGVYKQGVVSMIIHHYH